MEAESTAAEREAQKDYEDFGKELPGATVAEGRSEAFLVRLAEGAIKQHFVTTSLLTACFPSNSSRVWRRLELGRWRFASMMCAICEELSVLNCGPFLPLFLHPSAPRAVVC